MCCRRRCYYIDIRLTLLKSVDCFVRCVDEGFIDNRNICWHFCLLNWEQGKVLLILHIHLHTADICFTTFQCSMVACKLHGDHLSGKPGNVREFDSCQRNVRDFTKSQENVRGKNLIREKLPKTVYCKLYICVHTGI